MEEKHSLYLLAIVGMVAIVGVVMAISSANKAFTVPTTEDVAGQAVAVTKPINANSCNADDTCEINAGQIKSLKAGIGANGLHSFVVSENHIAMIQPVDIMTTEFTVDATTYLLRLSDTSGTRNGYVCTDYIGKLYRSLTPCVSSNSTVVDTIVAKNADLGKNMQTGYSTLIISPIGATFNTPAVFNAQTAFLNSIAVSPMAGNGTAYVCVDSIGKFFRSNNPCR